MGTWYETGYDGMEAEKRAREQRRNSPWRFFLKVGQSQNIVFLDDFTKVREVELPGSGEVVKQPVVPFCFNEHNLTVDGDWKNWFTCLAKIDPPCPICSAGHYKYYVGMYTVMAEWVDKDGVKHWSKRILAAKVEAIELIRSKSQALQKTGQLNDGQLRYCQFYVGRTNERSVVTGNDYNFVKRLSADEVKALLPAPQQGQEPLTIDPYPYPKLFAPQPKAELEKLLKSGRVQAPRDRKSVVQGETSKATVGAPSGATGEAPAPGTPEQGAKGPAESIDF